MSSTYKYALIGCAAVLTLGAVYYLSQDRNEVKYDPRIHTLAKLRKLVRSLFAKSGTVYVKHLNMLLNMQKANELTLENRYFI